VQNGKRFLYIRESPIVVHMQKSRSGKRRKKFPCWKRFCNIFDRPTVVNYRSALTRSWAFSSRIRCDTRGRPSRTLTFPSPCRSSRDTRWPSPPGYVLGSNRMPWVLRTHACRSSLTSCDTRCCRCFRPSRKWASTLANMTPDSAWSFGSVFWTSWPLLVCRETKP
jgi:hypothetical protein